MLNCGLGVIAFPIVGVVMLFKGNDILDFMNMIFGSEREGMLIVLVVTALSLLASMNDMVVPSVSLEGKKYLDCTVFAGGFVAGAPCQTQRAALAYHCAAYCV